MGKSLCRNTKPLGTCVALVLAGQVLAADTTSLRVQAMVPPSCQVDVAPLDFGVFTGAPLSADTSVSVVCQAGLPYRVMLEGGLGAQAAERRLASLGMAVLPYTLGLEATGQGRWAAGVAMEVRQVGTGEPQVFRIRGHLRPSGRLPPGIYRDVVQVTVQF